MTSQYFPVRIKRISAAVPVLILLVISFCKQTIAADTTLFPEHRSISANVAFWEKIYSTYSVNTAIIHDREDLDRIYTTITLEDDRKPGARQRNEILIENAKNRYATLLRKIATAGPQSTEEKKVARLFKDDASATTFRQAADAIRGQIGLRERFREGVLRSGAYLPAFKSTFRSHGLPDELAYLPHVESSFNPDAYSKFGASGMWQFTTGTGKEYLHIDYIIDERRDPFLSADAAARLLKHSFDELGSWPLALTAYNYGIAGMKRAVAEQGDYPSIFRNYRQGWFKFAARNFYPSFIAAIKVAKTLEKDPTLAKEKPLATVTLRVPAFIDSKALCRHLKINSSELARYNPALRDPVLTGEKYIPAHYQVRLPAHLRGNAQLTSLPQNLFHQNQKPSLFYRVRPGDTAGAIARDHRVSLKSLINANGLDSDATIRVGQNLRIPVPVTKRPAPPVPSPGTSPVTLKDDKKNLPSDSTSTVSQDFTVTGFLSVKQVAGSTGLVTGSIEVQPDETITLLADWSKSTEQSIRLANGLNAESEIHPGQTLILDFIAATIAEFEAARFDFHQEKQEDFFRAYSVVSLAPYTVRPGDTLWDLCYNKFEIPLWLLKKYNERLNYGQIIPSSTLDIPVLKAL